MTESTIAAKPTAPSLFSSEGHMSNGYGTTVGPQATARLTFDGRAFRLSGTLGNYEIPVAQMKRISRCFLYPWFFRGIKIRHTVGSLPDDILFFPLGESTGDLLRRLKSACPKELKIG